ncbi:MAG: hypothetical protein ABW033_09745 [Acidimicrobiia bacterium]
MKVHSRSVARARVGVIGAIVAVVAASVFVAAPAQAATASTCPDPSGSVKIGMSYFGAVAGAYEEIGGDTEAAGPNPDQAVIDGYKAGIAAMNDAGGLNGCEVEPVFFNFSAQSADYNQTSQQECAAFTQDAKVVAVYAAAYETKVAVDCFAKAKTAFFQIGTNYPPSCTDQKTYAGFIYTPSSVYTCRFSSFVKMWDDAGLFPTDAKVGILVMDDGSGQGPALADKVWTPELKKLKIPVTTFKFTGAINSPSFSQVNATVANAVLQFKAAGVNVVLFTPAGGQGPAAFMPQAKTQAFFPNYGLNSADNLAVAAGLGGESIKTGIAVSWAVTDLPLTQQQQQPANSAAEGCAEWAPPSTITIPGASPFCDFLNSLQAGFKGAKKMDAPTLYKGITGLGTSFVSSRTYDGATKFAKGRTDGATKAMMLEFDPTTKTFLPIDGKLLTIP